MGHLTEIFFYLLGIGAALMFFGILFMILFYSTYPAIERYLWDTKHTKTERLDSIVIPMGGSINKDTIEEITKSLNIRLGLRLDGKMDMIRSIDITIGPDNFYYITVSYKTRKCGSRDYTMDYTKAFRF